MFYYSLPVIFAEIHLITPGEFFLLLAATLAVMYVLAPVPDKLTRPVETGQFLLHAWLGGYPLAQVFWPFFFILNAGLIATDLAVKSGHLTVSSWDDIHFVLMFPAIWWLVSVWRCSANVENRLWSALARMATLLFLLEYGFKLLIRISYPRLFFSCEDLLMNYGNCF